MLIDRLDVVAQGDTSTWPFSVPAVRDIAARGLRLTSKLVVLIGANGSGKTILRLRHTYRVTRIHPTGLRRGRWLARLNDDGQGTPS
jgi:predicted ATPase